MSQSKVQKILSVGDALIVRTIYGSKNKAANLLCYIFSFWDDLFSIQAPVLSLVWGQAWDFYDFLNLSCAPMSGPSRINSTW